MDISVTVFIEPRQQAGPRLFSTAKPALASVVDRPYIREMCNDYEQHVRWGEYRKTMQNLELGISSQQTEPDLPQADDIRINDIGPVMRAADDGIELVPMTFSFPPSREGGAPVFNFRSEGRHFAKSNRCLVPTSAFFEFTGKRYPKTKHRFTLKGSPVTAIAGILGLHALPPAAKATASNL
jgi:putative SOS response-associated peptidase YedK